MDERPNEAFEDFPSRLPREPANMYSKLIQAARDEGWDAAACRSLLRQIETAHAGLLMVASSAWSIFLAHDAGELTDEEAARLAIEVTMLQCYRLGEDILAARKTVSGNHPEVPLLGPWMDYLDMLEEERDEDCSAARTRADDEAKKSAPDLELLEDDEDE
jgi:hypothetical protein